MSQTIVLPESESEPFLDFQKHETRQRIVAEIARVRKELRGKTLPALVAGKPYSGVPHERRNPSFPDEIVGTVGFVRKEAVGETVRHILQSADAREWARMPLSARAPYLRRAADNLRNQRFFFIALMVLEVGKQAWLADGEMCVAIELLSLYASYAEFLEKLGNELLWSPRGEKNSAIFRPYGPRVPICASIQPWNFPVEIAAGPTSAALVCGHSTILKPAEQSGITGYFIAKAFYDAGIPADVFHFLPGAGEEVGKALVEHPDITGIAFTGSRAVCDSIRDTLAEQNKKSSGWERRAFALESGGKNPMIVLTDADMNRVIDDCVESAFGYQGQRCSALSRLIVVDEDGAQYSVLVERLIARVRSLPVGPPEDFKNIVGPLIDGEALTRVLRCKELAEKEAIVTAGTIPAGLRGYFVPPMLVERLSPDSRIAREEIFGPLLAVFRVSTIRDAVRLANDSRFALTASVHSNNPEAAARIVREIDAGVIYLNGKTTGAIPRRQNFGGGKASGNGTKAGDLTYLLPFLHQVHLSENTMRCGIPVA